MLLTKHLEGWRQPVSFTKFLAEMVFWKFSFLITNVKKFDVLEKNFNSVILFLLKARSTLFLSAAWVMLQWKQSMFQKWDFKKSKFIVMFLIKKKENSQNTISAKKNMKLTVCLQSSKSLLLMLFEFFLDQITFGVLKKVPLFN